MQINTEKWGQESEWQVETNLSSTTWEDTNLLFYNGKYTDLRAYRTNEVFDYNEPIDYSICYGGHAADTKMPLADIAIYNYQKTKKYTLEADNGWFFATQVAESSTDFQFYQLLTPFETGTPASLATLSGAYRWSPDAIGSSETYPRPYNPNRLIRPIVKFSPKSFFGVVLVDLVKNDGSGMTTISLKALKNNIDTYKDTYTIARAFMRMYGYNGRTSVGGNFANFTVKSLNNMGPCITTPIPIGSKEFIAYNNTMGSSNATFPVAGTMEVTHGYNDSGDNPHYGVQVCPLDTSNNKEYMAGVVMNHLVEDTQVDYFYSRSYGYMYLFRVKIPITAANVEELYKGAAAYGFFFSDDVNGLNADTTNVARWLNENMYCGVLDDNGIGHGEYTKGFANATNPIFQWDSNQDSSYDPSKPPSPTPSSDPMLPEGLYFTMAGRGTGIWSLTPTEIDQVWSDIFGSDIDVKMFGNNPMNAILSLKWTPFDWTQTGVVDSGPIVLGDQTVNILHSYPMIKNVSNAEKHGYGTIKFNYDKNFYNARFMQARLFLPFYGYYELPTAQLLSSKLRVDFYYDVPDELGVYIISYDDVIYDYVECSVDMDVPLTGSNAAAINESKRSQALSIASQVAATAATAVIGASSLIGLTQAGRHLAQGIDALADVGFGWSGGIESEAYLGTKGAGRTFGASSLIGIGAGIAGASIGIANTIRNGRIERAALKTNLPYHGSALQTTFLHMSMKPYVQIFKNAIIEDLETEDSGTVKVKLGGESETQYKLKVGHACDLFTTIGQMPENSLLQTTGMSNMSSMGMELAEAEELNSILQSGFYR